MSKSKKDSITVRLDNQDNPMRKAAFLKVLEKRGASVSNVINNFVDAYIKADGLVIFPIKPSSLTK